MQEFTSISASSYDPAALATKLTEKSADGWTVVGIVPTGGDVTAFLCRQSSGASAVVATPAAEPAASSPVASGADSFAPSLAASTVAAVVTPEPTPVAAPVAEPAGWAMSPEPASTAMSPISEPAPSYQSQPASTYQPAAAQPVATYQPAAATPAVPAGWYADPAGRFELRYWDGGTWTEHVSRAGQQYTDPPIA